ncbi:MULTISPECIES: hypothetical protein [Cytobacillus]|uniref:Lipoprotein n=6 Tax=Cytobacillus TaxID=2675230 RepID=A0A160M7W9_9BACI|nr:hypothetical protein [Cytobacillus oceanisediminis]AND38394.1 hypothetical protein A361_04440 [Cytobacillus oceanisediminis 2691]EFV75533.1 hypothetical protein HMPREF1013_04311 [Bacillus sp. 2_A_57_CT2]MCM3403300.1 hypothetical protein [Cytobacillus oceanisediminis]MDK7667730.1 hypothetical protein [Cytobacillus oceanisediminis]OHX46294.1 hypothetical protein BBV17_22605 [Cytobacillus oceanisediminis]
MTRMTREISYILLILPMLLTACTQTPDFEPYDGRALRIAVVGEPPEENEEQVKFHEISFDELTNEELSSYDAVIMTEENLPKAAEAKYADTYSDSSIPFFFISASSYIPFTVKDPEYNDSWKWEAGKSYAVGVLKSKENDSFHSWGYGLYNDEMTDESIHDVYSRIFKTIDEFNH